MNREEQEEIDDPEANARGFALYIFARIGIEIGIALVIGMVVLGTLSHFGLIK